MQKINHSLVLERTGFSLPGWLNGWVTKQTMETWVTIPIFHDGTLTNTAHKSYFLTVKSIIFLWIDLSSSLISLLPNTLGFQGNVLFRWVIKPKLIFTGPVGLYCLKQLIQETWSFILLQLASSSIWTEKCVFNSFHGFNMSPDFSVFSALFFLYHSFFLCRLTKLGLRAADTTFFFGHSWPNNSFKFPHWSPTWVRLQFLFTFINLVFSFYVKFRI